MNKETAGRFLFFKLFVQDNPGRSLLTVLALFLAGVMEGIGVAMLLPVLGGLLSDSAGAGGHDVISVALERFFDGAGLPFTLGALLLVMSGLVLGKAILSIVAMREVGKTAAHVTANFRERLIRALLGARWKSYVDLALGRASTALGPEAERVSQYYVISCVAIADFFQVLIYFILALFMAWQLSLSAVVVGVFMMLGLRGLVKVTRRAGLQQTLSLNDLLKRLSDALGSVKAIKAMGRESHYAGLLRRDVDLLRGAQESGYFSKEFLRLIREPIVAIFMALGLYVAAEYYQADFSSLMVLAFVFMRMAMKFMAIQSNYQRMVEQESAFQSMSSLIADLEAQGEVFAGEALPALQNVLEFKDVGFSHDDAQGVAVLDRISAKFPACCLNIIVGPSGSGKTTMLDLIIGFYQPDAGDISLDGVSLQDVDMHLWRQSISYVPQDSGLFHDTVFNNIALGDKTVTDEKIWNALDRAGASDFVRTMPEGLQSNVGERGARLSGGQRQRIAIARALVRDPLLLLLDEPTSALDPQNEQALIMMLKDLSKELTIIMITHTMHLKPYADQLVELSTGCFEGDLER